MTYSGIYQRIYSQKRETILWARVIQVCEVYTHPPLSIGIQPLWKLDFFNETGFQQPINFLLYGFLPFGSKISLLLLNGFSFRVYIQLMSHEERINPWHIGYCPRKDITIVS